MPTSTPGVRTLRFNEAVSVRTIPVTSASLDQPSFGRASSGQQSDPLRVWFANFRKELNDVLLKNELDLFCLQLPLTADDGLGPLRAGSSSPDASTSFLVVPSARGIRPVDQDMCTVFSCDDEDADVFDAGTSSQNLRRSDQLGDLRWAAKSSERRAGMDASRGAWGQSSDQRAGLANSREAWGKPAHEELRPKNSEDSTADTSNEETAVPAPKVKREGARSFSLFREKVRVIRNIDAEDIAGRALRRTATPIGNELEMRNKTKQTRLQLLTRHWHYEMVNVLFIILNTVYIAWITQWHARNAANQMSSASEHALETLFSTMFCVVFTTDLCLRIVSERSRFLKGRELPWNLCDLLVVVTSVIEVFALILQAEDSTRFLLRKFSVFRILRLLRVIRMKVSARMLNFMRELRLMVFSLSGAMKALFWSVVLLTAMILVFGVYLTDGVAEHLLELDPSLWNAHDYELMREKFGSLSITMISLFEAVTGGVDWGDLLDAIEPLSLEYKIWFLIYIALAMLALLNVVSAVFLETAMQQSRNDRELMVHQEIKENERQSQIMRQVYTEIDTNNNGEVSFEEFKKHINDERIQAYLHKLELDASQIKTLFHLLDVDNSGGVEAHEFVTGCMKLRGGAKAVDVAFLKHQMDYVVTTIAQLQADQLRVLGCTLALARPSLPLSASNEI